MNYDLINYFIIGILVVASPFWLPFYLVGWAWIQVYSFIKELLK